tara:strand:- start:41 stop:193 length:153 start_codon:yes stop_codon:yes gene_type:complete
MARKIEAKSILANLDQNDTLKIIEFVLVISCINQENIRIIRNRGRKYLNT